LREVVLQIGVDPAIALVQRRAQRQEKCRLLERGEAAAFFQQGQAWIRPARRQADRPLLPLEGGAPEERVDLVLRDVDTGQNVRRLALARRDRAGQRIV
jgi:hypothetical protein